MLANDATVVPPVPFHFMQGLQFFPVSSLFRKLFPHSPNIFPLITCRRAKEFLVFVPFFSQGVIPLQPLVKPFLRPIETDVNAFWRFPLQDISANCCSSDFFFHHSALTRQFRLCPGTADPIGSDRFH